MKILAGVIAALCTVTLAGCSPFPVPQPTVTVTATPTADAPSDDVPSVVPTEAIRRSLFISFARKLNEDSIINATNDDLFSWGDDVCLMMDGGSEFSTAALAIYVDHDFDGAENAGRFAGYAVAALCPEHSDDVG